MLSSHISSWQVDGETVERVTDFIFLSSRITANGDCSHELKDVCSSFNFWANFEQKDVFSFFWAFRIFFFVHWDVCSICSCLLLGRKVMTNLDSILKSRNITLPTKVHLVKALVFPGVMYGCEAWTIKKSWAPKNWCFWTVVLEETLTV